MRAMFIAGGVDEGNEICKLVRNIVADEISDRIPVTVKRGCSEYAIAYPEYAQIGEGMKSMEYRAEWQEIEDRADATIATTAPPPASATYNRPSYTLRDAQAMRGWLKYAATIGDSSYIGIAGCVLPPLKGIKRPPFVPVDD